MVHPPETAIESLSLCLFRQFYQCGIHLIEAAPCVLIQIPPKQRDQQAVLSVDRCSGFDHLFAPIFIYEFQKAACALGQHMHTGLL